MDRLNPTNTFWKVALGFFPFYSNLQKRISDDAANGSIQRNKEESPSCSHGPTSRQGRWFHEVVCEHDEATMPEMEELSMGSGWSLSSSSAQGKESKSSVATPLSHPSDEISSHDGASSHVSTTCSWRLSSHSNSFYNFARTPSMNDQRRSNKEV